jgi:hypothetical protein
MTDRAGTPADPAAPEPERGPAVAAPDVPAPGPAVAAPEPAAPEPVAPEPAAEASDADPAALDDVHPWSEADRPRGLDAWFAPGGEDDAPPERIADERRLTRLLAIMVAALVGIPLLLTAVAFVIELASQRGS